MKQPTLAALLCALLTACAIPSAAIASQPLTEATAPVEAAPEATAAPAESEAAQPLPASFGDTTPPIPIDAPSAILMEAKSGQTVMAQNADEAYDVAGVTKIMSALVLMEAVDNGGLRLEDSVVISPAASKSGGMSAFLGSGESYPVETLFKAMMVVNANDAAIALAEKAFGSQEGMLVKMNEKAKSLGIAPVFVNPTGHNADGQLMSARDAAVIARALCKYPKIFEWSKVYTSEIAHPGDRKTELTNPNKLVRFYPGCDGFATGSVGNKSYSGVVTAERDGMRYIAVVLGAQNANKRSDVAKAMLDYAFANYVPINAIEKGKGIAKDIPVTGGSQKTVHGIAGEDLTLLIERGDEARIDKKVVLDKEILQAPVQADQVLGKLVIGLDGKELGQVPIVAANAVEASDFGSSLRRAVLDYLRR